MRLYSPGQIEMGFGGQTEEDDILLCGDGFELNGRHARRRVAFPDSERVTLLQQVFHGLAHFAVAEEEHPQWTADFHVRKV